MNLRLYTTQFVFLCSLFFGIQFVYLAGGDVLNHYPFITPDGFDWYMEGVYAVKLWGGASLPVLPVLRPPLFVFVTAADYVAGGQGLILAVVLGLSAFSTYFFSLKIIDSTHGGAQRNAWYIVPLAIGTTVYSLNFIKPYLLADSLAAALSLASVWLFIRHHAESKTYLLALSAAVAVIAGMTQTYALIPYLISCAIGVILNFRLKKNKALQFLLMIVVVSLVFIFLTALWRRVLPHSATPDNFNKLKLSADMFGFYVNTWSFYFLPFILFFIFFRGYRIAVNATNLVILSSAAVVLIFALLCFFYQNGEARFTYYPWPWLLILFFSGIRPQGVKGAYLISMLMLMSVALAPANYWAPAWVHFKGHTAAPASMPVDSGYPTWKKVINGLKDKLVSAPAYYGPPSWLFVRVNFSHNWVGNYFSASPVDRKLNTCGNDCAGEKEFLINPNPYVDSTVKFYNQIKGL